MHPEGSQLGATQGARAGKDRAADARRPSSGAWDEEEDESASRGFKRLAALEAQALRDLDPPVSPWRVVAAQVAVGFIVACLAGAVMGSVSVFWSALYGAGVVVVPAVLMARGMTSRLSSANAGVSAVSFMLWEFVKIGVSVVLLMLAPRIVEPLVWPALLLAVLVCIKVYWVALLWRGRKPKPVERLKS
ncbi:MAG: ATP synthase subunit I [Betaproteobacteria bacterium]